MNKLIVVAGGTGNLGFRIVNELAALKADILVLIRANSDPTRIAKLRRKGANVRVVDFTVPEQLTKACEGAACVVSALSGLGEVIIDAQRQLLDAAVKAGVPRFIPSDYSIDFTRLTPGQNRNLDLRRTFHTYLDKAPIAATTIFNGAFADMLTGQMPMVLFKINRVLYWGNADQRMDFTSMDNTAAFTARAALESNTPRYLHIAGNQITARELAAVATELSGTPYKLLRPGGLGLLSTIIQVARAISPAKEDLYPAWQGMQYLRDMLDGRAEMHTLNNNRYADIRWTTARDVLAGVINVPG